MYSKILVPLDGSETAEQVLSVVRVLSAGLKIPLELLGVVDISVATAQVAANKARYLDGLIAAGEKSLVAYLAKTAVSLASLEVDCVVERGKPADVIIAKAAADKRLLIAMATHGWTGLNRWLLGSVTEKVLRATNNHVFLVRACDSGAVDNGSTLKSVLVPLDGSALAEAVLPAAVEFAKVLDLEMLLFRAYDLPASAYYGREDYLPDYAALKKNIESEAREYLDEQVIALNAQGILKVRPVLAEGPVAAEIIRLTAAHPELLAAMCTHGRSGVKRWVLGSVTEKVLRHSQGPMLVVRGL